MMKMNKIKIDHEVYYPTRVRQYGIYEKKLRHILRRNPNPITFIGCISGEGKTGIVAIGEDFQRIRDFKLFYPLNTINKYFYENLRR